MLGRELREELTLNSSELRFSEPSPSPSLSPLLMELLSSHLKKRQELLSIKRQPGERAAGPKLQQPECEGGEKRLAASAICPICLQ